MKKLVARVLGPTTASLALPADAQVYRDGMGMWHGTWGWGAMFLGGLMMILFWAAVITLVVLLVRWLSGAGIAREQRPARSTAIDILEERFARGEINREEFEERRRVLTGQADSRSGST